MPCPIQFFWIKMFKPNSFLPSLTLQRYSSCLPTQKPQWSEQWSLATRGPRCHRPVTAPVTVTAVKLARRVASCWEHGSSILQTGMLCLDSSGWTLTKPCWRSPGLMAPDMVLMQTKIPASSEDGPYIPVSRMFSSNKPLGNCYFADTVNQVLNRTVRYSNN